jgi:hypothetical protein
MPNAWITVNNGMIRIGAGTMMPARTSQKVAFLPRNGIREKAKAAMLASTTVRTVMITEVKMLFRYQRGRSPAWNTSAND